MGLKEFYEKRKDRPLNEANWFLLDMLDEPGVRYIVTKEIVELMLCDGWTKNDILGSVWSTSMGWHIGNDDKVYERFALNDVGEMYYEKQRIKEKGPKFISALEELNKGKRIGDSYAVEKILINEICFKRNRVKAITKYEGKELDKPKTAKQEQPPKAL